MAFDVKKLPLVEATPLQYLPTMSRELGIELYVKRDDLTALGAGGNKLRKLEYLAADAIDKGATMLLTVGGAQTNHGRLTAAVAALVDQQHIPSCGFGDAPGTGEIPEGIALIAVALNLQRGTVSHMIVSAGKFQTVVGGNGYFFVRCFQKFCDNFILKRLDFPGLVVIGVIIGTGHRVVILKCQLIAEVKGIQECCQQKGQKKENQHKHTSGTQDRAILP